MGYIDDNLMSGEQVIYRTRLHWMVFLGPIIFAVIAVMFFAVRSAAVGGFFFLLVIIWGISVFISFKTSEFGITNKRVLFKIGFIRRSSLEILLTKIEGIQVNQGILGRILANEYLKHGVIPSDYSEDALHISIATINKVGYLLSWNFEHLVKVKTRRIVNIVNASLGYPNLEIITPPELI